MSGEDRFDVFYGAVYKHLQKAKNALMDDYMGMLGNFLDRMAVNNASNTNETKDVRDKRKTIEATVDKIEKTQRGLVRWLDYVKGRKPQKSIRVDSHEPETSTGRSIALARDAIARAVAVGDAFLDAPTTTDRDAKGLDSIIDSMEDILDMLR
jgi:hypothetical protein